MTRHWPVIELPAPSLDKWSQFSTDQLDSLVCRRLGISGLTEPASREALIEWLEHTPPLTA